MKGGSFSQGRAAEGWTLCWQIEPDPDIISQFQLIKDTSYWCLCVTSLVTRS